MIDRSQTVEAPMIRAFYQGVEIESLFIKRVQYVAAEDEDDTCELQAETGDRDLPSDKRIQEKLIWVVKWGYIDGELRSRIIKLQDIRWTFGTDSITVNIMGTDLGSSLKRDSKRRVWKNTNMLAMAAKVAEENGLDLIVDGNKQAVKPDAQKDKTDTELDFPFSEADQKLTKADWRAINRLQKVREQAGEKQEFNKNYYSILTDPEILKKQQVTGIDHTYVKQYNNWKHWDGIPQAGKSTIQILKEVGALEPGGPYLAETRDNKLIIRKRDFNQTPYKTYEYGGGNSDLIEFTPESSNRMHSSTATGIDYAGWDKKKKQFHQGGRDPGTKPERVLSELQETKRVLEKFTPEELRKMVTGGVIRKDETRNQSSGTNSVYGRMTGDVLGGIAPLSDNTRVVRILELPITAEQELAAVKEGLGETDNVQVVDPKANNGLDSFAKADNLGKNAELEKNPASAKIIGDPRIEPGMLITILEVSKKYMGNYYITKVTDEVDGSVGYITSLELRRHGHNIKVLKSQMTAKELGNKYNSNSGPRQPDKKRVKITTKKNGQR
jgi:hypothetical protein